MPKFNKFEKVSIKDITTTKTEFDENHPFYLKTIVFTGNLQTIIRKDAMQCVVDLGGIIKSNISRKTDFVVLGKQDKTLVGKDGMSTKERKARELVEKRLLLTHSHAFPLLLQSRFFHCFNEIQCMRMLGGNSNFYNHAISQFLPFIILI